MNSEVLELKCRIAELAVTVEHLEKELQQAKQQLQQKDAETLELHRRLARAETELADLRAPPDQARSAGSSGGKLGTVCMFLCCGTQRGIFRAHMPLALPVCRCCRHEYIVSCSKLLL